MDLFTLSGVNEEQHPIYFGPLEIADSQSRK
jgi:hypothetical protein